MKLLTATAAAMIALGATPLLAQSTTLERANARDDRSVDYRNKNCAPGNEAACARANAKTERGIANRTANATPAQKDPNAVYDRANAKDERSIAYRNANCAPGNEAACARANAKTERAMEKRPN